MRNTSQVDTSEQRVLIFSAQTPWVSNKQIYFLFSQHQVEDILMDTSVQSVPFCPGHIEGLAEWHNQALPVISLEACLGLEFLNSPKIQRLLVVRALKNETAPRDFYRVMIRMVPPIQMLTLPIECSPVSEKWIPEKFFSMGVYEWEDKFLVVANMKNILNGKN